MRFVLIALLVACSQSTPKKPPPSSPSSTGDLSEAQFKALHELPTPGPDSFKGQTIDLAGTKAYLSLPEGNGPFPAIIVIHEWWGLNPNIQHWADRLAGIGWAALAIDLYSGVVATDRDTAMKAMKSVDDAKAHATIHAAMEFLKSDPRIQAPKRAVIGWCFGGGWSLQTALAEPGLDGAIMYYGHPEFDPTKLAAIKGKLLGVFGNKDEGITPADVNKFEAALKQAGVKAEIHRYDADHAFANPSNPKYDQKNAADAWTKVEAFLASLRS
jgi:carboxymethylenebutenolidase